VLREKAKGMATAFRLLADMPEDFFEEGRRDKAPQKRKGL